MTKSLRLAVVFNIAFVVSLVRADEWEPGKTRAVIVGVLEWNSGLGGFSKVHRKDQGLRDLLVKRGVPDDNITMLLDQDATLPKIRAALDKTIEQAGQGSTLIVYYAGHGMPNGAGDYCFANYEIVMGNVRETGWSLKELAETVARGFKGKQVFLWADCCYSGGLEIVVERLAKEKIAAVNLTSASSANTSTANWTFTQSILDSLTGEPLVDADGDGKITLGEMAAEVREAMLHIEGQRNGFTTRGIADDFVIARAAGSRPKATSAEFALGSYVKAPDRGRQRPGRVVARDGDKLVVQFYDYCDKRMVECKPDEVAKSDRTLDNLLGILVNVRADCEVEWLGTWFPAKVLKKENGRFYISYIDYDSSWDEWVGDDRIRFNLVNARADCEVEWQGTWFPAKVLKKENGRFYISYINYGSSWDEWVGDDRIRFNLVKPRDECEVEWQGTWFPANVLKKENGRFYISYINYDSSWDEWVGDDRIRFNLVKARDECEVEWQGAWFPAKVLKKEEGRFYISYIDFDRSWDEWVGDDRIRFRKPPEAPRSTK